MFKSFNGYHLIEAYHKVSHERRYYWAHCILFEKLSFDSALCKRIRVLLYKFYREACRETTPPLS